MSPRRIVITGMGAVTGFGFEWQSMWQRMLAGEHCIRPWQPEGVEAGAFPVRYAAPVDMGLMPAHLKDHPAWGCRWKNAPALVGSRPPKPFPTVA